MDLIKQLQAAKQQRSAYVDEANTLIEQHVESREDGDFLSEEAYAKVEAAQENAKKQDKLISTLEKQIALAKDPGVNKAKTGLDNDERIETFETPKLFDTFGELLSSVAKAGHPDFKHQPVDEKLLQLNAIEGAGTSVGGDGGYLIQSDFATQIYRVMFDESQLASRCREFPIGAGFNALVVPYLKETSRADGSRWGGIQVYWVKEGGTVTPSKATIDKMRIELEKLMGICYMTEELLEDQTAMQSLTTQGFGEQMAWKLDDAIVDGSGAGVPLGILKSDALVTVPKETGQLANTIVKENIDKMHARLLPNGRRRAIWLANQEIEPQLANLAQIIGTGGVPVYLPPAGIADDPYSRLYGKSVIPLEQAKALGSKGDLSLVDLSKYALIRKGGVRQQTSMHVRFIYDEMAFKFTMRVNGQPMLQTAIDPANGTNTLSAFVTLAARA